MKRYILLSTEEITKAIMEFEKIPRAYKGTGEVQYKHVFMVSHTSLFEDVILTFKKVGGKNHDIWYFDAGASNVFITGNKNYSYFSELPQ
jgi:hypothetical protein